MKTRIAVGCGLLLTLGTAMAGTWIYGQGKNDTVEKDEIVVAELRSQKVTPEMIARWKVTATSTDYIAPRVPL
ncbi:MAG: hypothetical protein ABW106_04635 [Steroidobacteraceae bacterium]